MCVESTEKGRFFSRRMVRDAKSNKIARENGKKGGNPRITLKHGKANGISNADNPPLKLARAGLLIAIA